MGCWFSLGDVGWIKTRVYVIESVCNRSSSLSSWRRPTATKNCLFFPWIDFTRSVIVKGDDAVRYVQSRNTDQSISKDFKTTQNMHGKQNQIHFKNWLYTWQQYFDLFYGRGRYSHPWYQKLYPWGNREVNHVRSQQHRDVSPSAMSCSRTRQSSSWSGPRKDQVSMINHL